MRMVANIQHMGLFRLFETFYSRPLADALLMYMITLRDLVGPTDRRYG